MIKCVDSTITFAEIPTEISLAYAITNCENKCHGCHSPWLRKDLGSELTKESLSVMIDTHKGITCVLFLGEGNDQQALFTLADYARSKGFKTAVYSGRTDVERDLFQEHFDYVKIGPYDPEYGPLKNPDTNQRLYKITDGEWEDITYLFWKKE